MRINYNKAQCIKLQRCIGTCGHNPGKPPKQVDVVRAAKLYAEGWGLREIGRLMGVSHQTIKNRFENKIALRSRWRKQARKQRAKAKGTK